MIYVEAKNIFRQKATYTLPQFFFPKFLPAIPPGCLFIKKYFSPKHISFDLVFDAELDFNVENYFRLLLFVKINKNESEIHGKRQCFIR
jgi:hypothetical protein